MKLSENTTNILKNFSVINKSILIRQGNVLSTMAIDKSILGVATIRESFPQDVGIYDLPQFLAVLSLFKEPELSFGENQVTISNGPQKVLYTYAEPTMIKGSAPRTVEIEFPTNAATFGVPSTTLGTLIQGLSILGLTHIAMRGDGDNISLNTVSKEDKTASSYSVDVGTSDREFEVLFRGETFKFLARDYEVTLCGSYAKFVSPDLTYYVVAEEGSRF